MKNYFKAVSITALISLSACLSLAQTNVGIPDIEQVITQFFSTYEWEPNADNYLQFEKKHDGWWISEVKFEPASGKKPGQMFWNKQRNNFQSLTYEKRTINNADTIAEAMRNAVSFLNMDEVTFYNYRRNLYYGYEGWDWDVITALQDRADLSDTLQESLARAASSYAINFFYSQWGYGSTNGDSDRIRLKDSDSVSLSRVEKFMKYENLSIATYKKLSKSHPNYETLVGNIKTKTNNEQMFAFTTLKFLGYNRQAARYLDGIQLSDSLMKVAKDMLSEIKPNSIFITSGDNISYPVWLLQEQGFRKDIVTIDYNLLGLRRYLTYLDRQYNKSVTGVDSSIYMNPLFDYSRFDIEHSMDEEMVLDSFLTALYKSPQPTIATKGNNTTSYEMNPGFKYFTKTVSVPVNVAMARKLYGGTKFHAKLPIPIVRDYLLLNEMIQLAVINKNFLRKRIYFSYPSDTDAKYQGIIQRKFVWELTPEIK